MLIKISFDIWRDVFDCLSLTDRQGLAIKFNELGDREFSELYQKWLHEWTKNVCLRPLRITREKAAKSIQEEQHGSLENVNMELAHLRCLGQAQAVPFAETELPDNIQDFKEIELWYLDATVLQFLRRMMPLFHDVNLDIIYDDDEDSFEASRTALGHLLPLFTRGIEIVSLQNIQLFYTIRDHFPTQFFDIKWLSINMQYDDLAYNLIELLLRWLGTRRADGQPRVLTLPLLHDSNFLELADNIRQNFLNATSQASFFIWHSSREAIHESITYNGRTGEQLVIQNQANGEGRNFLLIGRCSSSRLDGPKWVMEMDRITDNRTGRYSGRSR